MNYCICLLHSYYTCYPSFYFFSAMASLGLVVFMVRAPSADFWYALPHHHIGWPNIHLGCLLDRISCYSCMFLLYPSLCHRICHFTSILIFRLVFKENWNNTTIVNALFADGRWVGYPFMCFFYWDLKMMVLLKGLRTCCYCCDIVYLYTLCMQNLRKYYYYVFYIWKIWLMF